MRILIAEDDPKLLKSLVHIFELNHYAVDGVDNGNDAFDFALSGEYDGLVLDIMMPGMDGITTAAKIREFSNVPIIFLTAKSETEDMVLGLNVGGDDYITKPFVPVEVLARVRSQLRRYAMLGSLAVEDPHALTVGTVTLDDNSKQVTVDGEPVSLTPIEYSILRLLMQNPGKVFSTKALYEAVWQETALGSEGAVAVHIRHLREKIEINPSQPRYLKVVWGQGYKMEGGK